MNQRKMILMRTGFSNENIEQNFIANRENYIVKIRNKENSLPLLHPTKQDVFSLSSENYPSNLQQKQRKSRVTIDFKSLFLNSLKLVQFKGSLRLQFKGICSNSRLFVLENVNWDLSSVKQHNKVYIYNVSIRLLYYIHFPFL